MRKSNLTLIVVATFVANYNYFYHSMCKSSYEDNFFYYFFNLIQLNQQLFNTK